GYAGNGWSSAPPASPPPVTPFPYGAQPYGPAPYALPPGAPPPPVSPTVPDAALPPPPPPKATVTRVAASRTKELTGAAVRRVQAASRADGAAESGLTQL